MLTKSQKSTIDSLEINMIKGVKYVLIVKEKYNTRYFYINSIGVLSGVCYNIFTERWKDGWYRSEDLEFVVDPSDGLSCYFFLRERQGEYESVKLERMS